MRERIFRLKRILRLERIFCLEPVFRLKAEANGYLESHDHGKATAVDC